MKCIVQIVIVSQPVAGSGLGVEAVTSGVPLSESVSALMIVLSSQSSFKWPGYSSGDTVGVRVYRLGGDKYFTHCMTFNICSNLDWWWCLSNISCIPDTECLLLQRCFAKFYRIMIQFYALNHHKINLPPGARAFQNQQLFWNVQISSRDKSSFHTFQLPACIC